MPQSASGHELPPGYVAPTDKLYQFSFEGFTFQYKLNSAGTVDYQVYDSWAKEIDNHICTVHQFECAMAALYDDNELSGAEYEDAECAVNQVRWIP